MSTSVLKPPPFKAPTQSQFFGAMVVVGLVLVCTAVTMTQKPPWMEGPDGLGLESPVGQSEFEPAARYTPGELRRMGVDVGDYYEEEAGNQARAEVHGVEYGVAHGEDDGVPAGVREEGRLAVEAAAQHPGGVIHRDDYYVRVSGSEKIPKPTLEENMVKFGKEGGVRVVRLRGEDTAVPVKRVENTMYPFIGVAHDSSSTGREERPGERLARHMRENGDDGEYVSTTTGGVKQYSVPPIERLRRAITDGQGEGQTTDIYTEESSKWALYGSVFLVLLIGIAVIGYHLLPKNSIENAWSSIWAEQQEQPRNEGGESRQAWDKGFNKRPHPHIIHDTYTVPREGGVPMSSAALYRPATEDGVQMRMV